MIEDTKELMADQHYLRWYRIIYGTVLPAFGAFGAIGNVLNLFVLTRMKTKASIIVYFIYMAVSDLVTCSLLVFGGIARGFTFLEYWWQTFDVYIFVPIGDTSACVSALTIVMVTVERIIVIQDWKVRKRYCTRRTAHQICGTIILFCVIINIPLNVLANHVDRELGIESTSFYSERYFRIYIWTLFSLFGIAPAIFLSAGNAVLICSLRRQYHKQKALFYLNKHQETKQIRDQTRLTATLVGIIVMFLLGEFASNLTSFEFGAMIFYGGDKTRVKTPRFLIFKSVFILPMVIHYSFNFVLYCALNSQFLIIVKNAVMCRKTEDETRNSRGITDAPSFNGNLVI